MSLNSYRELISWQKSMELVTSIYRLTPQLPHGEFNGLCNQIQRAAVSIPSNIAEGYARHYPKDYVKFLNIARGSIAELQTQLEICVRIGYLSREQVKDAYTLSNEVSKIISSTITTINNKL